MTGHRANEAIHHDRAILTYQQAVFARRHHWAISGRSHDRRLPAHVRRRKHAMARARAAIVGGTEMSIEQIPWQVAVFAEFEVEVAGKKEKVRLLCGGSIVDTTHVVTAGHCAFNPVTELRLPPSSFEVVAGASSITKEALEKGATVQKQLVEGVRIHPYFNYLAETGADDIAVLQLKAPLTLSGAAVKAIGLPASTSAPPEGEGVSVSGYGEETASAEGEPNGKLYSLGLALLFPRRCGGEADAVFLCAASGAGSACFGDSGGPVTSALPLTLVGVIDTGEPLPLEPPCGFGTVNGFANLAAPEIKSFIEGSERPPLAPRGGGGVAITGGALVGNTLGCEAGSWSNAPTFAYAFINGANAQVLQEGASANYALTAADVGRRISCQVEASNAGGTGIARTSSVGPVKLTLSTPTVSSITPNKGPAAGGTAVTIKGTGFERGATTVTIGSEATGVAVISPTELTAKTRAHGPGEFEVVVSNSNGASTGSEKFTYVVPKVSSVNPSSGPTAGGTSVTIEGSGFEKGATTVIIGSSATNVVVVSETELTAKTPANAAGSFEVVVSDKYGTSTGGPHFTYVAPAPTNEGRGAGTAETGGAQSGTQSGTGSGSGGVLSSTKAGVGSAQIEALLRQLIARAAKIAALLKAGGLTVAFTGPEAGVAIVDWYQVPRGARLAGVKPVLVASGRASFAAAGTQKIKLKLTSAGRRLLKHAKSLKLTAKGVFTPTGEAPVSVRKPLTLKR